MTTEYSLHIKNAAGVLQAIIVGEGDASAGNTGGFLSLSYRKVLNGAGIGRFVLNSNHSIVASIAQDWQVEVHRWDTANSIAEYVDFYGFFRDEERSSPSAGVNLFTGFMVEQKDLLARDIVAYPAATANRSLYTSVVAETICNTIVKYNCTSAGGTADGRHFAVEGWTDYVSVEADGAEGNSIDFACANQNVMDALREVTLIGGGDFDLVQTSGTAWEWRWYTGQLGTDRSGSVTFSLLHGNMENPTLRRNRLQESTVAIVGGQGEEADRTYVRRTGSNYSGTVNARVVFLPATSYTTAAGLNAAGDVRLNELQARDDLTFDVLQVPSTLYGSHYFLGDKVTGYYEGVTATKKITAVTVDISPGGDRTETIRIKTQDA